MSNQTLQAQLIKYANQDLAAARKAKGFIGIIGTKQGVLEVGYNKIDRNYIFSTKDKIIGYFKKKEAIKYLIENYVITMED